MKKLNNNSVIIKIKSGLKAVINATATKALASLGEFHYCTDTKELFIFNGTENVLAPTLETAEQTGLNGTFTNGDGDTVTVVNGIITSVL